MASRFQNVTDADVRKIKIKKKILQETLACFWQFAIYTIYNLFFKTSQHEVLTRSNTYKWPGADCPSHFFWAEFSVHSPIVANYANTQNLTIDLTFETFYSKQVGFLRAFGR